MFVANPQGMSVLVVALSMLTWDQPSNSTGTVGNGGCPGVEDGAYPSTKGTLAARYAM